MSSYGKVMKTWDRIREGPRFMKNHSQEENQGIKGLVKYSLPDLSVQNKGACALSD